MHNPLFLWSKAFGFSGSNGKKTGKWREKDSMGLERGRKGVEKRKEKGEKK
jgi:hypothetical protein